MRDNESLREFVKRFGQAVLQIEVCSMDAVLQIFKRSICPGTPFFESLAKKPPTTMDDLFRRANKYSMLEDDVRAATQQVLVAGRASRDNADRHAKPPDRPKPVDRRQDGPSRPNRWPRPLETDPSIRDRSKKCAFHKDHGHTTETCRSLQYLVERLIKAGHLKQYLAQILEEGTYLSIITLRPEGPSRPQGCDKLYQWGPSDEEYDSRRKRQKLLRAASIRERINSIRPGSSADLVQASVIGHMGHGLAGLENPGRILSGFNGSSTTSLGDIILPVRAGPVILNVQFSGGARIVTLQYHLGRTWLHYMKAIPFHISSNEYPSNNHEIFAWTHSDMKGIHPSIASHKLNVFPAARPIRQKIRRFHPDRQRVIQDEINKLLEAGFIREVSYPDWLANVVVVPKKEGKWRVCVDYTNLNNACPKDSFPLPRIDQIVDSTSGQGMLSFLDAFSGYHQIPMSPDDEEKTAFITPHGLYCYKVMSFGLKNAGATQRGIEVSPDQVKAVMETPPPRNKKELQRLTGKLVR
ncbi:Transposon Ty3-I Gag-Pol polyprotein [Vitis vinifera]|uniref:Transposon Ty3-I Gag-Pol polyprotein n=1 Tax=Vitis vinifera TaxID=29760 RepID=A0A438JAW4_VITVI|nr:Transposon Ty3-I Gag-Pol polyprotein [Vitis vinifera]